MNKEFDLIKNLPKDNLPASDVPRSIKSEKIWGNVVVFQFLYSTLGMFSGLSCVLFGVYLIHDGLVGVSKFSVKISGLFIDLTTATPGVILVVVGVAVVVATRFVIKSK